MAAYRLDLLIEQGSKFQLEYVVKDSSGAVRDLTGYTARMQARPTIDSDTILFDIEPTIAMDGTDGTVTIFISHIETTDFDWTAGVYDLEIINSDEDDGDDEVERILEGGIVVSQEVTR